jgi:hypothetical protein
MIVKSHAISGQIECKRVVKWNAIPHRASTTTSARAKKATFPSYEAICSGMMPSRYAAELSAAQSGCRIMALLQLPKLITRVRFPSPAPSSPKAFQPTATTSGVRYRPQPEQQNHQSAHPNTPLFLAVRRSRAGDVVPSSTPRCRAANWVPVGAAEGCDKVGTTFRQL